MLSTGVFPDRLKYATVKPLYKNNDRHEVSNYRPVSVSTSFSKMFEKVIHFRILNHLTGHNILSIEQRGFRANLKTMLLIN
jgi:hypothetical protein